MIQLSIIRRCLILMLLILYVVWWVVLWIKLLFRIGFQALNKLKARKEFNDLVIWGQWFAITQTRQFHCFMQEHNVGFSRFDPRKSNLTIV